MAAREGRGPRRHDLTPCFTTSSTASAASPSRWRRSCPRARRAYSPPSTRATTSRGSGSRTGGAADGRGSPAFQAALPAHRAASSRGVIDTHAHLAALDDPDAVVERAAAAGVTRYSHRGALTSKIAGAILFSPRRTTASLRSSDSIRTRQATASGRRHDCAAGAARASEGGRGRGDGPRLVPRLRTSDAQQRSSAHQLDLAEELEKPVDDPYARCR